MWEEFWARRDPVDFAWEVVIGLFVLTAASVTAVLHKSIFAQLKKLISWFKSIGKHGALYRKLRSHVRAEKPLFEYRRAKSVVRPDGAPLALTIMNFKGGVGKTTLTANLAAYFAQTRNLRTLIIDLDYQSSLTDVLRPVATQEEQRQGLMRWLSRAQPTESGATIDKELVALPELHENLTLLAADEQLTEVESNQRQRWLLEDTLDDVRTRLARQLWRPCVADQFDIVILDAPPRLSLASMNALVCSTHVLVPTKPQTMSALRVPPMLAQLESLKDVLNARFEVAGVTINMTHNEHGLTKDEEQVLAQMSAVASSKLGAPPRVLESVIRNYPFVGKPAHARIAYLGDGGPGEVTRRMFDRLGDEISAAMGLPPRTS